MPRKFRFPRWANTKAKGELAESIFVVKAQALGLQVSKPLGENQAFDFHVQSRLGTFRVQVKSAWKLAQRTYMVRFNPRSLNKASRSSMPRSLRRLWRIGSRLCCDWLSVVLT